MNQKLKLKKLNNQEGNNMKEKIIKNLIKFAVTEFIMVSLDHLCGRFAQRFGIGEEYFT